MQPADITIDDRFLRAYLLGRLSTAEEQLVEESMYDDAGLHESMRSVEADLLDDFAAGRLDAKDHDAVVARFRGAGVRRRVAFAAALQTKAADSRVVPFRSRSPRIPLLTAAAAAVITVGALFLPRSANLPVSKPPVRAARVEAVPAPPLLSTVTATIVLGGSRGVDDPPTVVIPRDTGTLQLRVQLRPDDAFDHYGFSLRSAAGTVVASREDLRSSMANGDRILTIVLPAETIASGSHEIAITGHNDAEPPLELGFKTVEFRRDR